MKWLLIFIVMGIDTPIYLEFNYESDCVMAGLAMQKTMKNNISTTVHTEHLETKDESPTTTYVCVEQE